MRFINQLMWKNCTQKWAMTSKIDQTSFGRLPLATFEEVLDSTGEPGLVATTGVQGGWQGDASVADLAEAQNRACHALLDPDSASAVTGTISNGFSTSVPASGSTSVPASGLQSG